MAFNLRETAAGMALLLAAAGCAYAAGELVALSRFGKRRSAVVPPELPGITVLKPLRGDEPQLYENLKSFCEQAYPDYQIIFGAHDPSDPALNAARRLIHEFPDRDLSIASGEAHAPAANPKIANLLGMIGHAKHELLTIVDSDIRVGPQYLQSVAAAFADERTGAATCLYAGIPCAQSAARLGALIVRDHFMPSVLVALMLEPLAYCFGATMAVRRRVLEEIGGLEALAPRLGDDFMLGKLVHEAGYTVALCDPIVSMTVSDRSLPSLWAHQLRWQRTVRASRPRGFAGSVITYVLPLACISAVLSPWTVCSGMILGCAAALRLAVHFEARKTFAPHTPASPWSIPLADTIVAGTWLASFFGSKVSWRGEQFEIQAGGRLAELNSAERLPM